MLVFLTFTLRTSKELMLFEFDMYRNSRLTPGTGCLVYKCWRFHRSHKRCKEFLNYTAITSDNKQRAVHSYKSTWQNI